MEQMKLPHAISILGEWIKIKYVEDIPHDSKFIHGDYNDDENLIRIRMNNPDFMAKALLHELMHALLTKSGWADKLGEDTEESLCRLVEHLSLIYYLKLEGGRVKCRIHKLS